MYPNDAVTARGIRAVSGDSLLISTTTSEVTVLNVHLDKFQQASQLVQCRVGAGAPFTTLTQATGSSTAQDVHGQWVLPVNTVCYLRTFDSTLTQAYITYVPRNIASTTMSSSTQMEYAFNQVGVIVMLIVMVLLISVIVGTVVRKLT